MIETYSGVQLPALWYALRRNADYSPSGPRGPKTHISFALRLDAVPAFVTTPDGRALVGRVESYVARAPLGELDIIYPRRVPGAVDGIDSLSPPPGATKAGPIPPEQLAAYLAARSATNPGR
ncbi:MULTISPECIES: hypothetical protein [unclassified Phenylobacterium]|uniref:hypothetical protein n=1 Tax=unclassified Phenylobacterium TaxID=2640670 RepID=UPI00083A1D69|nr:MULTISPECIES: hypothetical protein [unclassified Phenylobacterium]